jgi:hypothetical protein
MAHADRVQRLLEFQGSHPVERAMLEGEVLAYEALDRRAASSMHFARRSMP